MCTVFFFHENEGLNKFFKFETWDGYTGTVPCVGDQVDLYDKNHCELACYTVVSRRFTYHGSAAIMVK